MHSSSSSVATPVGSCHQPKARAAIKETALEVSIMTNFMSKLWVNFPPSRPTAQGKEFEHTRKGTPLS